MNAVDPVGGGGLEGSSGPPQSVSPTMTNESDSGYSRTSGSPSKSEALDAGDTEAGPDIAEEEEFRSATEVFKDPNAFEFLSQHGGGGTGGGMGGGHAGLSQLARESLYVKFDPLVGGRPSVMGLINAGQDRDRAATPTSETRPDSQAPTPTSPNASSADRDLIAMNSPSPQKSSGDSSTPRSFPSHAEGGGGPRSNRAQGSVGASPHQLEFQEQLLRKESQIAELEQIIQESLSTIEALKIEVKRRKESEDQMKQVLKEYEKTISELIAQKEKEKEQFQTERQTMMSERDQAVMDLQNVESAFSDVHRKYERTKQVVEGFRQNEETLKTCVDDYQQKLRKQDQKYELLKNHAEDTLDKANKEIENIARQQEAEMARLSAMLKKTEMKASSLEKTVEQKTRENEELTSICDELISKVGHGPS
ncbi:hypothetical protein TCAL_03841 [Tigriopus californicus]|uniref:Transforming acidic coiled-coil-containing protein C-terminal domain-containing protein n=1 Tax=Tigriopus californicus TaxID=6832 RepID=A0A553PFC2_TIGCA|nr:transforming acidic coiled-coil-containing protein 3-like [Tigriopus californicus]TRY76380.1 hypothetical protein TCAL_03841 [Tigriopus californicus]|eukprot:TCALIF_03841-PA protein Name:"Similar to TACC2 Transforming acidic coiled-coil-containing protein 2 (Homo sapiens)" AED:0.07 eAED:0.16 QI:0/-1/0/1/-1/1/1/0/421